MVPPRQVRATAKIEEARDKATAEVAEAQTLLLAAKARTEAAEGEWRVIFTDLEKQLAESRAGPP